jgi:hypothetical protein
MKAVRARIRQITTRKRLSNPLEEVVKYLNKVIRGWRNYLRIGNSTEKLQDLDCYVRQRLRRFVRSGKRALERRGIRCLVGTKRGGAVLCPRDMRLKTLKAPGRGLSESHVRGTLTYGSRWQGMETTTCVPGAIP